MAEYTDYDLGTSGLTPDELSFFHAHLTIREVTPSRFAVSSKSKRGKEHEILHDSVEPIECLCDTAQYNKGLCYPQAQRVRLVLLRHNRRIAEEEKAQQRQIASDTASARRLDAPLGSRPFSLTGN